MTLEQLWDWATDIARSSKADSPLALHAQDGDRDDWGSLTKSERGKRNSGQLSKTEEEAIAVRTRSAIRGLPFSRRFERFVDHELPRGVKDALEAMKPSRSDPSVPAVNRQAQHAMFNVCRAVVRDGMTDREACRQRLGLSEFAFKVSATNGLLAFKSALERSA